MASRQDQSYKVGEAKGHAQVLKLFETCIIFCYSELKARQKYNLIKFYAHIVNFVY